MIQIIVLVFSASFFSMTANAEVINKTGKTFNACELAAIHKSAKRQGLYEGPNEPTAELNSIKTIGATEKSVTYDIQYTLVDDGDWETNRPISDMALIRMNKDGKCALPALKTSIITDNNLSQCVANSPFDKPVYCNENLSYYTQALGMEYYRSRSINATELNDVFINYAKRRLIEHNPEKFNKFNLSQFGEFRVSVVTQKLNYQKFVAVEWLDIDDDSYTVFFEMEYPNLMVYVYYEN